MRSLCTVSRITKVDFRFYIPPAGVHPAVGSCCVIWGDPRDAFWMAHESVANRLHIFP